MKNQTITDDEVTLVQITEHQKEITDQKHTHDAIDKEHVVSFFLLKKYFV